LIVLLREFSLSCLRTVRYTCMDTPGTGGIYSPSPVLKTDFSIALSYQLCGLVPIRKSRNTGKPTGQNPSR
jgi:hypothetical protein